MLGFRSKTSRLIDELTTRQRNIASQIAQRSKSERKAILKHILDIQRAANGKFGLPDGVLLFGGPAVTDGPQLESLDAMLDRYAKMGQEQNNIQAVLAAAYSKCMVLLLLLEREVSKNTDKSTLMLLRHKFASTSDDLFLS